MCTGLHGIHHHPTDKHREAVEIVPQLQAMQNHTNHGQWPSEGKLLLHGSYPAYLPSGRQEVKHSMERFQLTLLLLLLLLLLLFCRRNLEFYDSCHHAKVKSCDSDCSSNAGELIVKIPKDAYSAVDLGNLEIEAV